MVSTHVCNMLLLVNNSNVTLYASALLLQYNIHATSEYITLHNYNGVDNDQFIDAY